MTRPILYSFRRCPYAMRARMALAAAGINCTHREILLRDKPAPMIDASPKGTVPVLIVEPGTVIDESLDVMDWALGQHDPDGWLFNDNRDEEMRALAFDLQEQFKGHLDRYKYPSRYEDVNPQTERDKAVPYLLRLEKRLADTPWLFGTTPRFADFAIFPFVRQFAHTDRDWFYAHPELAHTQDWLQGCLALDIFKIAMQKYTVWSEGDEAVNFPPSP